MSCNIRSKFLVAVCAFLSLSDVSYAGHVQSWLDSRGGCSPGPLMGMNHVRRGDREFLGKKALEWTDADIEEFRQLYSACTRRYPAINIMKLNPTPAEISADIEQVVAQLMNNFINPARAAARAEIAKGAAARRLADERAAREEERQAAALVQARESAAENERRAIAREQREREEAREQAERDQKSKEARDSREEQAREKLAQDERENSTRNIQRAAERAERTRQRLQKQAEQDRRATEELLKQVEAEELKTSEAAKEADAARQARTAAEKRLAQIRGKGEAQTGESTPKLMQSPENPIKENGTAVTLGIVAADFSREFNDRSASMGFDLRASQKGCSAAVRTACQFKINERIGVVVASENDSSHATSVTIILTSNGDPLEVMKALSSFMVVAKVLSPSLRRQTDNSFVSQIFLGLKDKNESEASADGVRYQISTGAAGLWFTAEAASP